MTVFPWSYFWKSFKVGFFYFFLLEALVLYFPNHSFSLKAANLIMRGLKELINFPVAPCLQSPRVCHSVVFRFCTLLFKPIFWPAKISSAKHQQVSRQKSTRDLEIQSISSHSVLVASIIFQIMYLARWGGRIPAGKTQRNPVLLNVFNH